MMYYYYIIFHFIEMLIEDPHYNFKFGIRWEWQQIKKFLCYTNNSIKLPLTQALVLKKVEKH